MMLKLVLIAAALLAGVGAVAATAGTASAASEAAKTGTAGAAEEVAGKPGTIIGYATSYTSPSNTSIPVHNLKPGTNVETLCFREGQVLNGNPYWFLIKYDGQTTYVHRDAISAPHDLQHC